MCCCCRPFCCRSTSPPSGTSPSSSPGEGVATQGVAQDQDPGPGGQLVQVDPGTECDEEEDPESLPPPPSSLLGAPPLSPWAGVRNETVVSPVCSSVASESLMGGELFHDVGTESARSPSLSRLFGLSQELDRITGISSLVSPPPVGNFEMLRSSVAEYSKTLGRDMKKLPDPEHLLASAQEILIRKNIDMNQRTTEADWLGWTGDMREVGRHAASLGIPLVWTLLHCQLLGLKA